MSNLEAWKTWQKKIAVSSNYKNPNISQIGSGDPNLRSSTQNIPQQPEVPVEPVPNNYSTTSYNEKITQNKAQIADIDAKLNNVITRKDELKLIEVNKISNKKNIVQTKTIQNSAYRELQATEDGLISQKNQLQQEIQIAKDKIQQGGLDSQAGEQFSAGISLDPVMDQDRIIPDVPTAPAMNPIERAQYFDKEDTLLNPNFTMEDVAQGLTQQGASYLGGDNTILDKAMASPILDLQHGLSNPSEYELAKDYGYTNMDASAKEISENPARFVGNVLAEGAMAVAPVGTVIKAGKIGGTVAKITGKEINEAEKLVMKSDMGKLDVDPNITNIVKLETKSNDILASTAPIKTVTNDIASLYTKTDLNPSGTVNMVNLAKINQQKRVVTNENLKTVGDKIGVEFSSTPTGIYKDAKKFTGLGIGVGGALTFGQMNKQKNKKTKKSNNVFNFKY
jgi:hypothetical protein